VPTLQGRSSGVPATQMLVYVPHPLFGGGHEPVLKTHVDQHGAGVSQEAVSVASRK